MPKIIGITTQFNKFILIFVTLTTVTKFKVKLNIVDINITIINPSIPFIGTKKYIPKILNIDSII